MKYNRSLDHVLLAIDAQQKGQPLTAAKHFARAGKEPDIKDAIRILEASNAQAQAQERTKIAATKRIKASEEVMEDDDVAEGTNDGLPPEIEAEEDDVEIEEVDEDDEDEEVLSGDLDELEDGANTAEDEADIAEFAAVLASMKRKRG